MCVLGHKRNQYKFPGDNGFFSSLNLYKNEDMRYDWYSCSFYHDSRDTQVSTK